MTPRPTARRRRGRLCWLPSRGRSSPRWSLRHCHFPADVRFRVKAKAALGAEITPRREEGGPFLQVRRSPFVLPAIVWPDPFFRLGLTLHDDNLRYAEVEGGWEQVSSPAMADFDNECFFIAPIGDDDSDIRKRSNGVRDWVVKPAAKAAADLKTVRADEVGEPGQITAQAVQHCLKAKAAVADLTEGNPNVYYELSVRHGALLPVVLIAELGTKLPFDISQLRVIF